MEVILHEEAPASAKVVATLLQVDIGRLPTLSANLLSKAMETGNLDLPGRASLELWLADCARQKSSSSKSEDAAVGRLVELQESTTLAHDGSRRAKVRFPATRRPSLTASESGTIRIISPALKALPAFAFCIFIT